MQAIESLRTSKVPRAIRDLKLLHLNTPSRSFSKHLELFRSPKEHRLDIFTEGVSLFTRIANLSPSERMAYYGSSFAGLHYNNDLAKLWNESSDELIKAHQLNYICPSGWDYQVENGYFTLVYRGNDLNSALDKLLQGPTVIDCGMFCQLSIWFGIKYMLGEEAFNEIFGRAPFYLTQSVYAPITSPIEPYMGNPLYPFFEVISSEEKKFGGAVSIVHLSNHKLYQFKHPGGNYGGDNCIVINGKYTIFDPTLEVTSSLSKHNVEQLLLRAFNAQQDVNDHARLAVYAKEDAHSVHPKLGMSYGELIKITETLSHFQVETIEIDDALATASYIQFDFDRFCDWVEQIQHPDLSSVNYKPLDDDQLHIPSLLENQIPYENRARMSFSTFTVITPLQREMRSISEKFCLDVMSGRSVCAILTGKAGIGKTASAVSCAKELTSRQKSVIWISEVMVRGWADKAKSMEEVGACRDKIKELLATNPDAIFLDDDNLVGYAGRVLLEEIYRWYASTSGKGLFITSNEPVSFKDCYGLQLDKKYLFPPFPGYTSFQYTNTILRSALTGQSMRLNPTLSIMELSDQEKITALTRYHAGASVGIIISADVYEVQKHRFFDVEFVPSFPSGTFDSITASLLKNRTLGPTYDKLSSEQKKYTRRFRVNEINIENGRLQLTRIYWYDGISIKPFERTDHNVIVVELLDDIHWSMGKIIQENCLAQLLRVINYAHDCGGKKVILLNNTKFSHAEMLNKIKEGIPEREKERTLSRIDALLLSPELATAFHQNEKTELLLFRATNAALVAAINIQLRINPILVMATYFTIMEAMLTLLPGESFRYQMENIGNTSNSRLTESDEKSPRLNAIVQSPTCQTLPFSLFSPISSQLLYKLNRDYLVENRDKSPELRKAYDEQFGLVLRR